MEKKSSVEEVYKIVKQDLPKLYKILCNKLGEDNLFAKISIGPGFYVWSDNSCVWHSMSEASNLKQDVVKAVLFELKNDIARILGEKTTDVLFTVPDDSYIFYNDDSEAIKILIAGWGFKKPIRVVSGPDIKTIKNNNPVSLSFSYDGEILSNYEFGLKLAKQVKRLMTGNDGFYKFKDLKVGEHYILVDLEKNQECDLHIIEGKSQYDFDVTAYTMISVSVIENGSPVPNENISLTYHGNSYRLDTDSFGNAKIKAAYHNGDVVSVSVRDEKKQQSIDATKNNFSFSFETPIEEPQPLPKKNTNITVLVLFNNQGMPNHQVNITYGGHTYEGATDENGKFIQEVEFFEDVACEVTVEDYEKQSKVLNEEENNKFVFEKNEQPNEEDDALFSPYVVIKRHDGSVVSNYSVCISESDGSFEAQSDEKGKIQLQGVYSGEELTVTDINQPTNSSTYHLDINQLEYVFYIDDEQEDVKPLIKLIFRDVANNAISCEEVNLHQDGVDDLNFILDEEGVDYIDSDHFKIGIPVEFTFKGWKKEYKPLSFTIDKDEYEYLIQEKAPTILWKRLIVEILLVVLAAILCCILWPFMETFVSGVAEEIYN